MKFNVCKELGVLALLAGLWACDDDGGGSDAKDAAIQVDGAAGAGGADAAAGGEGGEGGMGGAAGEGGAGGMGGAGGEGGAGGMGGMGGEGGAGGGGLLCEPVAPDCEDEQVLQLALNTEPSERAPTNRAVDDGFISVIDTTGGVPAGSMASPDESYVYARFTEAGLEQVAIGDEDSFASMDWDIALRRYLIRLNSGFAGPSCVQGARTAPDTEFDTLDAVPDGVTFFAEQYMTDTCEIIPDGSGLPSANTVLSSFWTYEGCLRMTGNVYIIKLADGRSVKLRVDSYYADANQVRCNNEGSAGQPSNAGNVTLRWAFLP